MKISNEGILFLKKYERLRLKAYKAHPNEQYYTIGWGHYGADVEPNQVITEERADLLFQTDLQLYENGVNRVYQGVNLSQNQFDALVIMAYNCGVGAVSQTLLKLIKQGDKKAIVKWWENHYITCEGQVLKGLQRRRAEEAELFTR
jgi:GH24 family phage-related lysozyme (muramidase)